MQRQPRTTQEQEQQWGGEGNATGKRRDVLPTMIEIIVNITVIDVLMMRHEVIMKVCPKM